MHLLVDALSVSNLSGRHVLLGHLRELSSSLGTAHQISLVCGPNSGELAGSLPKGVTCLPCRAPRHWAGRAIWGLAAGRKFARQHGVHAVLSPSGMLGFGWGVPQVVLAQNPLPLLEGLAKGADLAKSWLQRRAFARAQLDAARMVYNSGYMRDLYAANFGATPHAAVIAYQGIDDMLLSESRTAAASVSCRGPTVLSVSVMARHKAVEVLIDAFARVAAELPDAQLILAGSWPDSAYRSEIEQRISRAELGPRVSIKGHVSNAVLHQLYAEARVFALMSRCESFGIPAVEAQAFGTPVLVSSGTAAPEIVGRGGVVVQTDDVGQAAAGLMQLLCDNENAEVLSKHALENAQRFRWSLVSQPLIQAIVELAADLDGDRSDG